jgi:hypothetical protein
MYAIREMFVGFLNQLQTNINAKTFKRAKASLANFAAAVRVPILSVA